MAGKTISTSETRIEALQLQSSAYGVVVTLAYGVTRIAGNLLGYFGFKAIPATQSQGGKGGVKVQNTTFSYRASVVMGLQHGPIAGVPRIWRGKKLFSGGLTAAQLLTATESYAVPGSGAMSYSLAQGSTFTGIVQVYVAGSGDSGDQHLAQGIDFSVSAGTLTVLREIWRGRTLTIQYQYTSGSISQTALQQLGLSFKAGAIAQSPWSALSGLGDQELGYSGIALLCGQDYDLGTGAQVENHLVEVIAPLAYHLGSSIPDVDTSLVVRDVFTNARYGAGFPSTSLAGWDQWSDWCVASGLLVSPALERQESAAALLQHAAELTNAGPVWSGGKLRMVPYADAAVTGNGRTFTPDLAPVYDLDDECFIVPLRGEIKSPTERFNHWRIQYRDRAHEYNDAIADVRDQADIDANGLRSADIVKAPWICDGAVATRVGHLLMQRSLNVVNRYTGTLPWHFVFLEPMDLVRATDAGLGLALTALRVVEIEENEEGDLELVFEDHPAGTTTAAVYPSQAPAGYAADYNAAPGNVATPVIFEGPAALSSTGVEVYAAVRGAGANWGGCQVWVSLDGTSYRQIGVVYGGARYGTLSAAASGGASSIAVQGLGSEQLLGGTAADAAALHTLCYIGGSNPEFLAYQTATLTGPGAYTLGGLVHAAYGTAPAAHSSGDAFVRVDDRVVRSGDLDVSYIGKTISFKFCSFNLFGAAQQSLADVSAYTHTVTGAMAALQPAGAVRTWVQPDEPPNARNGDVWYDSNDGYRPYQKKNGAFAEVRDGAIATAQGAAEAAAVTADAAQDAASAAAAAASAAQDAADAAALAASNAQTAANTANTALANIASDSLLTPDEKPRVILDYDVIIAEQSGIEAQADNYAVTTEKTAYSTAVSALTSYLASLTSPVAWNNLTGSTTIVGATFRAKFADVYTSRQAVLDKINANAKARLGALATLNSVGTAQISAQAVTASQSAAAASASVGKAPGATPPGVNADEAVLTASYANATGAAVDVDITWGFSRASLTYNGSYSGVTTAEVYFEYSSATLLGSFLVIDSIPDPLAFTNIQTAASNQAFVSVPDGETLTATIRVKLVNSANNCRITLNNLHARILARKR